MIRTRGHRLNKCCLSRAPSWGALYDNLMTHALFDLTDKVAIITGSTRGLGRAIAEAYLQAGASVVVSSEDNRACASALADFQSAGYERVMALKCDVSSDIEQRALIDAAVARFGGLDILVANAGIGGPQTGSIASPRDAYDRVMDVNLNSIVRLCGWAVPALKSRGGGSIILMSSLSGLRGNKTIGAYALAKAALSQLARNLAVEFGPDNIRANAIAPGFIRTDLAKPLLADESFMARRMQNTPLRRPGEAHEIAGPALFLAARGGAFVNGQTLVVDGGTLITDGN
jgi:NAD(P)-dependent dehydrogenase (short-subunit alcohol dehydrogenase family)